MARTKAKSDDIRYICHKKVCRTRGKKIQCQLKLELGLLVVIYHYKKSLFMTYAFVHQLSCADTVRETSTDISEDGTHVLSTSIETV